MSDNLPEKPKGLLDFLSAIFLREPQDKDQLVDVLRDAEQRELLDAEALGMVESAMQLSEMQVRDVMTTISRTISVRDGQTLEEFVKVASESGHSRLPVFDKENKKVIGILLVKDLLQYFFEAQRAEFDLLKVLHPPYFVPESKRLDSILKEFKSTRNHMAIVINEYGSPAGLVTIEDVLEQIVGEIEDEHDIDEDEFNIKSHGENRYTVKAATPLEDFNDYFKSDLISEDFDTVGGMVLSEFAYLPKRGESMVIDRFNFTVLHADNRRLRLLEVAVLN